MKAKYQEDINTEFQKGFIIIEVDKPRTTRQEKSIRLTLEALGKDWWQTC